jgi:chitinase domain-containing protein 1
VQVLGYVTPWNNDGYTVSETFGAKFSFISPVWYQLRSEEGDKVVLTGGHDVSKTTAHFTQSRYPPWSRIVL